MLLLEYVFFFFFFFVILCRDPPAGPEPVLTSVEPLYVIAVIVITVIDPRALDMAEPATATVAAAAVMSRVDGLMVRLSGMVMEMMGVSLVNWTVVTDR